MHFIAETSEQISTEFSVGESTLDLSANVLLAHVGALTCTYIFYEPQTRFGFSRNRLPELSIQLANGMVKK
jgi:hypothetical protein